MSLAFRIQSAGPESVARFWRRVARGLRYECELCLPDEGVMSFALLVERLGQYQVTDVSVPVHVLLRETDHIARDCRRHFSLYYMCHGRSTVNAGARRVDIHSGQCLFLDQGVPHRREFHEPSRFIGLHLPRSLVASQVPYPENIAFQCIDFTGWGEALAAAMRQLPRIAERGLPFPMERLGDLFLSLLSLSLPQPGQPMKSGRVALLRRLRQVMLARLHDHSLTPDAVAAAEGISKRLLHAVLNEAGTSFGKELAGMRLDHARRMLEDVRFRSHSIAEIALLCGFTNSSHFGRRFRERNEVSPAVYRALMQPSRD